MRCVSPKILNADSHAVMSRTVISANPTRVIPLSPLPGTVYLLSRACRRVGRAPRARYRAVSGGGGGDGLWLRIEGNAQSNEPVESNSAGPSRRGREPLSFLPFPRPRNSPGEFRGAFPDRPINPNFPPRKMRRSANGSESGSCRRLGRRLPVNQKVTPIALNDMWKKRKISGSRGWKKVPEKAISIFPK